MKTSQLTVMSLFSKYPDVLVSGKVNLFSFRSSFNRVEVTFSDTKPEIVLYGATHIGRDFAPRIAARCNTGLTADCTHLDVKVSKYIEFAKANTTLDTSTLDPNDPSTVPGGRCCYQSVQHRSVYLR